MAEMAREAGGELLRGDYCAMAAAGLGEPGAVSTATDADLLGVLGGDRIKMGVLRTAAKRVAAKRADAVVASTPVLEPHIA